MSETADIAALAAAMARARGRRQCRAAAAASDETGGGDSASTSSSSPGSGDRKKPLEADGTSAPTPPNPLGGDADVASKAADAARRRRQSSGPKRDAVAAGEGSSGPIADGLRGTIVPPSPKARRKEAPRASSSAAPPPRSSGGIALAAAVAARRRDVHRAPKSSFPPAPSPGGIGAMAAEAARRRDAKAEQKSAGSSPAGVIGAPAAEAAGERGERARKSQALVLPTAGNGSLAAEAARKKELTQHSSPPALPLGGIAAAVAEAARKKEPKQQPRPSASLPGGMAATAAEAARRKETKKQSALQPKMQSAMGITALAVEAARTKELRRQSVLPALPPGGIAAAAAEAARKREKQAKNKLPDSSTLHEAMASASPDNPGDFVFDPNSFDSDDVDQSQFEGRRINLTKHEHRSAEEEDRLARKREARPQAKIKNAQAENRQHHQQNKKLQQQRQQDNMRSTRRRLDFDTPPQSTPGTIDADVDDYDGAADEAGFTPMNFDSQLSSLSSRSSCEPPMHSDSQADIDAIHAKAAEALIRVIEMKQLDIDHILEKLDIYKRKSLRNRHPKGKSATHTPIDIDDYNPDDGGSVSSQQSYRSSMSTLSANHRKIASNSQKLATHIMHTPGGRYAALHNNRGSMKIPLKNDPEYSLYYRMLRYGFTIGAVRAALIRDGKVDITRLDPDLPVGRQRVPRVGVSEVDDSVASGGSSSPSRDESEHSPGAGGFEDRTNEALTIGGLQFDSKGLTDEGWENALNGAAVRHRGSAGNVQISSPTSSSQGRASPLGIPLTPGGGLLRKKSVDSAQSNVSGSHASIPPWLQPSGELGVVEGWLRKKTRRGRWVRRWYLLDSTGIYYSHSPPKSTYTSGGMGKFTKLIDARTLGARRAHNNAEFEILDTSSQNRAVATLRAASEHELEQWVDAINIACERQRLVDEVVVGSALGLGELKEMDDKFERVALDTQFAADQERRLENAKEPERGLSRRKCHRLGEGGVGVSISYAELRAYKRTSMGGSTGVAATPDDFNTHQSMSEVVALAAGAVGGECSKPRPELHSSELLSGPPNPLFDAGRPKRPKLLRQNSWPPVMLMSDDRLDKPGREGRFVDADLSHGMNLFAPGGGVWSGNGASGRGGGGSGTGDGSGGDGGSDTVSAEDNKDGTKDGGEFKLEHDPKYQKVRCFSSIAIRVGKYSTDSKPTVF